MFYIYIYVIYTRFSVKKAYLQCMQSKNVSVTNITLLVILHSHKDGIFSRGTKYVQFKFYYAPSRYSYAPFRGK